MNPVNPTLFRQPEHLFTTFFSTNTGTSATTVGRSGATSRREGDCKDEDDDPGLLRVVVVEKQFWHMLFVDGDPVRPQLLMHRDRVVVSGAEGCFCLGYQAIDNKVLGVSAKFDIEKFDGTGDFGLWRVKMRALLIQHGCETALEVLPDDMEAQAKAELNKKAHSAVILCLGNKVSREVTEETTAAGVWTKLETLYMKKSLANKLYPKKKMYTFYMPAGLKISEHIDEFNKIVLNLANIEVVMATLNSKEIKERSKGKGDDGEGLYARGRTDRRDSRQSRGKSRSKSRGRRLKCYICQYEDHLKRNCSKNNFKKSIGYVKKDDQPSSSGSTYDDSENAMGTVYCWVTTWSVRSEVLGGLGIKGK
uniref:Retrovirus-related Pol polyprotein from transposon TNT 1-94 n=1 Tax=Tanacetum cinerariifolium TaxID=118510 RepID=A0A699HM54_TANCI|nr:retrovirus-related Pol polyprotein from transposon TNT 1-94 [Tanacetum cinerariifolium]